MSEATEGKSGQQSLSDHTCDKKVASPKNVTGISENNDGCGSKESKNVASPESQCQSGQKNVEHPEISSASLALPTIDHKTVECSSDNNDHKLQSSTKEHTSVSSKEDSQAGEVSSNPTLLSQNNHDKDTETTSGL